MGWIIGIFAMGIAGGLGGLVGVLLVRQQGQRNQLLDCYTSFFADALDVALKDDAPSARAALFLASRTSHRLELIESNRECIRATGMLFAMCHAYVEALAAHDPVTCEEVAVLRSELSDEYAKALGVVRQRLGFDRASHDFEVDPPLVLDPAAVPRALSQG